MLNLLVKQQGPYNKHSSIAQSKYRFQVSSVSSWNLGGLESPSPLQRKMFPWLASDSLLQLNHLEFNVISFILSVEMPTVLSKHKGELFGKRINVKVNSHWYICQKVIWCILLSFGLSWHNSKLSYNKLVFKHQFYCHLISHV